MSQAGRISRFIALAVMHENGEADSIIKARNEFTNTFFFAHETAFAPSFIDDGFVI